MAKDREFRIARTSVTPQCRRRGGAEIIETIHRTEDWLRKQHAEFRDDENVTIHVDVVVERYDMTE